MTIFSSKKAWKFSLEFCEIMFFFFKWLSNKEVEHLIYTILKDAQRDEGEEIMHCAFCKQTANQAKPIIVGSRRKKVERMKN